MTLTIYQRVCLVSMVPDWVLSLTHLSLVWSFQFLLKSYGDIRWFLSKVLTAYNVWIYYQLRTEY